ncbi:XRE family transcriptional regulator [Ochrobactrum sp. Marseille-Q0166]|uniref:XRE family transcriptional regulator n=1 Tax=Ochrobactrum sp. Marseille-Q0166 TaxID=2761105 RepID=UPI0032B623B2
MADIIYGFLRQLQYILSLDEIAEEQAMLTGPQCRAARALVEFSRDRLAQLSGVDAEKIEFFERKIGTPSKEEIQALHDTLENVGAQFIWENGGGLGVRLKFNRSEAKRIASLENEGGTVGYDDVP